jgi:class 3 adenylate cyclase/TolB-like protein/tetratricopeptide (TPR) repeat protein
MKVVTSTGEATPTVGSGPSFATYRKVVAALSADIVGYTSMMEAAEDATHNRIKQLETTIVEPQIDRHLGRVVKNTGDGFLASFDSAVDAARCALAIQDAFAAAALDPEQPVILFRMGINLTEAIIDTKDIYGDGVNLAARLQASSEPGGILVSKVVAEHLQPFGEFELVTVGELKLKNMRRSVSAYSIKTTGRGQLPAVPIASLPDDRPSIAVLPFRMDPPEFEHAWCAEGIIEGIIHVLSGIENMFVISRGTSLAYAGRTVDPRMVGRELGVRYVLSGVVRYVGGRLRVFTELSDATSGGVLRSDRSNGMMDDLFEMQDRIATEVVSAIAPAVRQHELARAMRKPPDSVTAYDLLLQGIGVLYQLRRETYDQARGLLQQAMAADPNYAPAYSHAATWHMFRIGQGWSPNPQQDVAEAERCAVAALARDGNDAVALAIHGQMLSFTRRDYTAALSFLDRALLAGPSCHMAWALSSTTAGWIGDGKRAVEHATRALQLSPLDPFAFFTEHMLSQGHYVSGNYEQAVAWGRRSDARNGMLTSNLRTLAAACIAAGQVDEGRKIAARILATDPGFSLARFAARSAMAPHILEFHIPRLRAAGLPD